MTFLTADQYMKQTLRTHLDLTREETIPSKMLFIGSAFVAVVNTLIIMPFDCIKTQMQRAGNNSATQRQAFMKVMQQAGVKGLFVGWRIRFAMYQLHAIMTVTLLDKLEVAAFK